ncbi:hypothetical protein HKX48_000472 [Thoreauomyces humboldtii]|nr:hypothetical protein HKX48_000472 [Thoreauomyces humboldtii]
MSLNQTQVQQCLGAPAVQGFFTEYFGNIYVPIITEKAEAAAVSAAAVYGGPGVMVGATWPLVLLALVFSSWRLKTKPSIRAALLFISVLLNLADTSNSTYGKVLSPLEFLTVNSTSSTYYYMLVLFSQIRCGTIFAAASWRYAAVCSSHVVRRIIIVGMCVFAFGMTAANLGVGIHEIMTIHTVDRAYWGIIAVLPIGYIVLGLGVFSRSLRNARSAVRNSTGKSPKQSGGGGMMAHLESANNILMGLTFSCCFVLIVVSQSLKASENDYVVPTSLLMNTLWTLFENGFEVLTLFQKEVANSSTPTRTTVSATGTIGSLRANPVVGSAVYEATASAKLLPAGTV